MAHAQKPDFVFRRNGRVHLNRQGARQFSRLLAAEVCTSALVMMDTPCSEVVWRVLATHSTRMFPLHFPYRASPCAITFQLSCTTDEGMKNMEILRVDFSIFCGPCFVILIYSVFQNVLRDYKNLLYENRRTRIYETCTDRRNSFFPPVSCFSS